MAKKLGREKYVVLVLDSQTIDIVTNDGKPITNGENFSMVMKINEQFKISKVIVLKEYTGSIYELYTKNENGKFYFFKLEPILDTLNLDKFLNKLSEGEIVYNCFGEIIKNHLCDQPIFKVYIEEINSKIKKK